MAASGSGTFINRSWRRFRRRPMRTQAVSWVLLLVIVGGVVFGVTASSGNSKPSQTSIPSPTATTALDNASTSSRGVTATSIRVVFPISNLTSLSSTEGFAGDIEFGQQAQAINTYVNAINAAGGINGRKIIADIVNFDATSETDMRSLCKQWTEGSPPVFAVLDGIGAWTGDNELCITQEGHTPFIGAVDDRRRSGPRRGPRTSGGPGRTSRRSSRRWSPGASRPDCSVRSKKVGIIVGDRSSDQIALNDYLLPDFQKAGLPKPVVETMPAQVTEQAEISSDAPLVVERLESAGVQSVIPLIPFNAFFPYLQAETQQKYYPKPGALGLRGHDRDRSRSDPDPVRAGTERPGGDHRRDARRIGRELHHERRSYDAVARERRRLRPGSPGLLQHLEGAQRTAEGQVAVHRGARSDRRLVPGDNPVRGCGAERRDRT